MNAPTPRVLEFEKRFCLTSDQITHLKGLGQHDRDITLTDELWDTNDFELTKQGLCLRRRNGDWELKVPLPQDSQDMSCREELTDETAIAQALAPEGESCTDLNQVLATRGIVHQGTAIGVRSNYSLGNMTFDFANFTFEDTPVAIEPYNNIVEIEIVIASEEEGDPTEKIRAFADEHGLPWERVKGKFPYMISKIKAARKHA